MKTMLHNLSKAKKSVIAALLCMSMVIGLLLAVPPVSAQAVEINAQDQGFTLYGLGSGTTTGFATGDKISVTNTSRTADSKKTAVYSYDGDGWSKDGDDYVVWQGTGENTFEAYYPVAEYASYAEFTIPVDQIAGVSAADWMTATYTGAKGENDAIDLTFHHRLAKVTVKVTGWGDEYTGEETLSDPVFAGKHSVVTANGDVLTGNDTDASISTAWDSDKAATAILIPATYGNGDTFFTFKVDEETLTVNAPAELKLESGNHYTFNLTVGKEAVTLTSVTVTGWADGGTIDGGVAEAISAPQITGISLYDQHGATSLSGTTYTVDISKDRMFNAPSVYAKLEGNNLELLEDPSYAGLYLVRIKSETDVTTLGRFQEETVDTFVASDVGNTYDICYSNDGGNTWTDTGYDVTVIQSGENNDDDDLIW